MENFGFLKNDYRDLYLLCSDVAKYIDSDKSISMLKARQAIEYIVKYLGAETDDLFVNINNLEDKNIANSRLIDLFHLIRKKANKSVHNEINADVEGVLDALIEICVWLAVGHDKKSISVIKFTDKEKYFFKKYGQYEAGDLEEEIDVVDTINPLEVVGNFSNEDVETADVLEQDVFETYEEYCERIESLPAIKIGYAFLDSSQIDGYCEIAFPLFHVSKHPKIESASVAAFYVSDIEKGKNIDGIIKAKLKAQYELGRYYKYNCDNEGDEKRSFEWLKKAAEQGYDKAQYELALSYEDCYGIEVVTDDDFKLSNIEKIKWYKKAAEQGNIDAQISLADYYYFGAGTEKDERKAFEWYKKAAEQGHIIAQFNLGVCYANGDGTEQNKQKACYGHS